MELIRLRDVEPQPWRNGNGTSWLLATDDAEPPEWRISVALIDRSAEFSPYRGYDRTIVALDGGEVVLQVDGREVALEHLVRFHFEGDKNVTCTLRGEAARDLNVMTARRELSHDVEVVTSLQRFVFDEEEIPLAYVAAGTVRIGGNRFVAGDAVFFDDAEDQVEVDPQPGSCAIVVRITPL